MTSGRAAGKVRGPELLHDGVAVDVTPLHDGVAISLTIAVARIATTIAMARITLTAEAGIGSTAKG